MINFFFFFFSSRRRHTRLTCDWSSDVCSSDLGRAPSMRRRSGPPFRSPANRRRESCPFQDRKSTRLNSSHMSISYAVFCLKKKKIFTSRLWSNQHTKYLDYHIL